MDGRHGMIDTDLEMRLPPESSEVNANLHGMKIDARIVVTQAGIG